MQCRSKMSTVKDTCLFSKYCIEEPFQNREAPYQRKRGRQRGCLLSEGVGQMLVVTCPVGDCKPQNEDRRLEIVTKMYVRIYDDEEK